MDEQTDILQLQKEEELSEELLLYREVVRGETPPDAPV